MYENNKTGFIEGSQKTDFVFGVSSPLPNPVLQEQGNWLEDKPDHEIQVSKYFDTYACTNFAGWDCIESLFTYYIDKGLIPVTHLIWLDQNGYIKDGKINFSERRSANFSDIVIGTGTYIYKACDAIIKHPLPQSDCEYTNNMTAEQFYSKDDFTEAMDKKEAEFKKRFQINWYWADDPSEAIKSSPLMATVRFDNGNGLLAPEGSHNHCIMVHEILKGAWVINDSYQQELKTYKDSHVKNFVGFSLIILNENTMDIIKFLKDNDQCLIRNTDNGSYGVVLQGKLRVITPERAGLFMVDREARGIIGKKKMVSINHDVWYILPKSEF